MLLYQLVLGVIFWLLILIYPINSWGVAVTPDTNLTSEQVLDKYFQSIHGSKERMVLLKWLETLEKPHSWWLEIYNNPYVGSELRWITLQKLLETALTFEECGALWPSVPSEYLKSFFNKYLASAQTLRQRFIIYKKVYPYEWSYENKTRKELLKSRGSLEEWVAIYLFADPLSTLEIETLEKIKKHDEPFDKWTNTAFVARRGSRLWKLAIERMFVTAKIFDHAYETWQLVQNTNEEDDALKLMFNMSETFVQKLVVLECSIAESKIEKQVFGQLLEMANSKERLQELSRRTSPGSKFSKLVEEKMKNLSQ